VRPKCEKNVTKVLLAVVHARAAGSEQKHTGEFGRRSRSSNTAVSQARRHTHMCVLLATDSAEVGREAVAVALKLKIKVYLNEFKRTAYAPSKTFVEVSSGHIYRHRHSDASSSELVMRLRVNALRSEYTEWRMEE
jgi:hypothetical protein